MLKHSSLPRGEGYGSDNLSKAERGGSPRSGAINLPRCSGDVMVLRGRREPLGKPSPWIATLDRDTRVAYCERILDFPFWAYAS